MDWEKHFPLGKMEGTHWEFYSYHRMFGQKALRCIFLAYVYNPIALVNELKRLKY